MNLKLFLAFSAALLIWILASKVYMLLYYWAALVLFVSFLNTPAKYKQQPYKWLNLLFYLYMFFIVWERTRGYKFTSITELVINDAEHILFAVVVSQLIALAIILTRKKSYAPAKTIFLTVIIFNVLGVVNECFQNMLAHRPIIVFIPDSQKDMLMNICGTVVFVLPALLIWKRKAARLSALKH